MDANELENQGTEQPQGSNPPQDQTAGQAPEAPAGQPANDPAPQPEEDFSNRLDLSALNQALQQVRQEVGKLIVGQQGMVDMLLTALLADGHVLLEGVPGVAKTLTAKLLARVVSVNFSRVQFTPDLMPSDVVGTSVFNSQEGTFNFRQGPVFSNLVLIDEINRAPAKTQAALFEVMEERQVTIDGQTYTMAPPFMVLATQNPVEQEGTYRLPEAQLDRFLFKVNVDYPSVEEELTILQRHHAPGNAMDPGQLQPVLNADALANYRSLVHQVLVEEHLMEYMAKVVHETRQDRDLYLGASPRATIALLNSSKAYAALQGRDFITPEDIKTVALPVLRHRVMLTPEKEMEGESVDALIARIVDRIEIPR